MLSDTFVTCRECGAKCSPIARKCWLCNASLSGQRDVGAEPGDNTFVPAREERSAHSNVSEQEYNRTTDNMFFVALLAIVLLIGAGIALQAPGLAISFGIIVVPAMLAAFVKRERRMQTDRQGDWKDVVGDFLGTLLRTVVVTIGILFLLPFALVIALWIYCLATGVSGSGIH